MLVIRFLRTGKRNQPSFSIVVTEKERGPKSGRFIEKLGFYNPLTKERKVNAERAKYWLSVGAKPSDTVWNLLVAEKILEGKKIPVHAKAAAQETKGTEGIKKKDIKEADGGETKETERIKDTGGTGGAEETKTEQKSEEEPASAEPEAVTAEGTGEIPQGAVGNSEKLLDTSAELGVKAKPAERLDK